MEKEQYRGTKMINKVEGIVAKYHLKDYVRFYSARCGKEFCNEETGYIQGISYSCTAKGLVRLEYHIADYIGSTGGTIVPEEAIIQKEEPAQKDFGYKQYLEQSIKSNKYSIEKLEKENKYKERMLKELEK